MVRSHFKLLITGLGAFGTCDVTAFEETTLVFAGDLANPPYESLENGVPTGFAVDLARAIAEAGGLKTEHRLTDWSEALSALEDRSVDVVTMYHSPEREEHFLFTPPFHYVHHSIYGRTDSPAVLDVAGLEGFRVALEQGSYAQERLHGRAREITLIPASNAVEALEAVRDGGADYAIVSTQMAAALLARNPMPVRSVSPPLWSLPFAFAVPVGNRELADWLTQRFYEVIRAGTYQALYSEWEDQLEAAPQGAFDQLLDLAIAPAVGLGLLALTWGWRLRRTVATGVENLEIEAQRRRVAEMQALWLTEHDSETELPRLQSFAKHVEGLLANDDPTTSTRELVALRLAEVDKVIHSRGHEAGRMLLQDFARWLRSLKFEVCGQDGRDVFLIFDDRHRIRQRLHASIASDDTAILRASRDRPPFFAGACAWPVHAEDMSQLLRKAEMALARAVETKQTWIDYRPSMEPDQDELELISRFRESAGEGIYSLFQPQLDLRSGAVVGAEALVRWDVPGLRPIPPGKFIALIEDAGFVHLVTRRMIRDAVRLGVSLRSRGLACPISVNVTVSDLLNLRFRKKLHETIAIHQGLIEDLKLELTETSFARESDTLIWSMMKLSADGVCISIDDFGTGYSSLSYLGNLPVNELKIDRSFVDDMVSNSKSQSIVRSTIDMSHELGLVVVAEGVETEEQIQMLRTFRCDRAQGYLISRPLREDQLIGFVEAHN